jgi:hypothetical protein
MKLFILSVFCFAFHAAKSQEITGTIDNVKILKDPVITVKNSLSKIHPSYQFEFKNDKGLIFKSSVDNMKCLAPVFSSQMPVAGFNEKLNLKDLQKIEPEKMPNALGKDLSILKDLNRNEEK